MTSIFSLLNTSRRAMDASQMGVQIADHNIANINTPGYIRQELMLTPMRSLVTAFGDVGMGVNVDSVRRVNDEFLQKAMFKENAGYSEWKAASDVLGRVDVLTGVDGGSSLGGAITDFFNAFDKLSTNVEDNAVRSVVVNAGVTLADRFHDLSTGLDDLKTEIDTKIARQTKRVSGILAQVASLNQKIIASDANPSQANDLKVSRSQLLNELSGYVNIKTEKDQFGGVDVYVGGHQLVHRDSAVVVSATPGATVSGASQPVEVSVDGFVLDAHKLGGGIGSLVETRDNELASVRSALDQLAGTIAEKVNTIHRSGFSPAGSGVDFFDGTDATTFQVNEVVRNQPEYVAHSYDNTPGDNTLAKDIAALRDTTMDELGGRTPVGFFGNLVGDVGSLAASANSMVQNKDMTKGQLQTRIDSVSGVSLDEEVANVTRFKTMYEASAKMMNTVNNMLDTLISLGGTR